MYTTGAQQELDTGGYADDTAIEDLMEPPHSRDNYGYQQQQQQQPSGFPTQDDMGSFGLGAPSHSPCVDIAMHIRSCAVCSRLYSSKISGGGSRGFGFWLAVLVVALLLCAMIAKIQKHGKMIKVILREHI